MNYEGEIREINLVERLIELWRDQFTGAIRFENDGIIKIIYFKGGDILSASTNDRADSVDEILMRAGKVSKEHVKQALTKRKETETLGDALLHLGFITRKELTWARRIQVINVIRSIEGWETGSFTVVADYLPKREEGTIFPLPQVVVEMIVTDQDRGKYERLLESGAAVFTKTVGHDEIFRKLGLNEDAEAVMQQVDGERQATEVAAASRQDAFDAFKLLHALSILGILERKGEGVPALASGFETAGVADAADAWGGASESQEPKFQFDDISHTPSMEASDEISLAPLPGLADPLASPPSVPAWDVAPTEEPAPSFSAVEPPSLDSEPDEIAVEVREEKSWGFDEAQVETARKVTDAQSRPLPPEMPPVFLPPPSVPTETSRAYRSDETMSRRGVSNAATRRAISPPKRKSSRSGLLIGIIGIFLLGALGYYAYQWWQGRDAADAQPVTPAATTATAAPIVPPVETAPPAVGTIVPVTETIAPAVTATTAPATTPPPAKAAPSAAPSTGDRARYEAMAREFAANPSGNFTVQFAIVCEPSNVAKALRTSNDVWFGSITLKGRSCFRMFWGRYGTRAEAEAGLQRLPGELRESRPAVVGVPR